MVKAAELRIGNWVLGREHGTPEQITEDWFAIDLEVSLERKELPIPLTHAILEKCGFKVIAGTGGASSFYMLDVKHGNYCFILKRNKDMEFLFSFGNNEVLIRSLHQLQNLYFVLMNSELEIEF